MAARAVDLVAVLSFSIASASCSISAEKSRAIMPLGGHAGHVVDLMGHALPQARIEVLDEHYDVVAETETTANGAFLVTYSQSRDLQLRIGCSGHKTLICHRAMDGVYRLPLLLSNDSFLQLTLLNEAERYEQFCRILAGGQRSRELVEGIFKMSRTCTPLLLAALKDARQTACDWRGSRLTLRLLAAEMLVRVGHSGANTEIKTLWRSLDDGFERKLLSRILAGAARDEISPFEMEVMRESLETLNEPFDDMWEAILPAIYALGLSSDPIANELLDNALENIENYRPLVRDAITLACKWVQNRDVTQIIALGEFQSPEILAALRAAMPISEESRIVIEEHGIVVGDGPNRRLVHALIKSPESNCAAGIDVIVEACDKTLKVRSVWPTWMK